MRMKKINCFAVNGRIQHEVDLLKFRALAKCGYLYL